MQGFIRSLTCEIVMIKYFRIILLAAIVGFLTYYAPVKEIAQDIGAWIMYPIYIVEKNIVDPINRYWQRRTITENIVCKYQQLFDRYEQLVSEHVTLLAHYDTIMQNKWLDEYQHRYDGIVTIGQVLTRLISTENQSFILDVGSRQGVERDMVAVYKDCLVGRVVEVFPCMCRVALLTDQASAVPAWCSQTKSQGIAKGTGSSELIELNYVNHLDALVKNDMVISHGEGLIYPKGLCIGFVQDWQLDGFFYKVSIKPAIDVEEITYCTLVSKGSSLE